LLVTFAVMLAFSLWPALQAGAQEASYQVQFSYTFTNEEAEPVVGLHVALSSPAEIMLDENGHAGPFRNVQGNGNKKIILTNPKAVIPTSGEGNQVELTFRTQKKELKVSQWWWLDEKGKPIGKKKKG
jgi:hypothetical protein